jgi:hypothetical protein
VCANIEGTCLLGAGQAEHAAAVLHACSIQLHAFVVHVKLNQQQTFCFHAKYFQHVAFRAAGKEVVQPTIVDASSFATWAAEAFQLWTSEWANCYEEGSAARAVISDIAKSW